MYKNNQNELYQLNGILQWLIPNAVSLIQQKLRMQAGRFHGMCE